jgi:hypothetical protein
MKTGKSRIVQSILWILFYLTIMDVGVNIIFRFPIDPQNTPPSFLQDYFECGRSVEGKLDRMTGHTSPESNGILGYGWIKNKRYESLPNKAGDNQSLVAVYGMSHTKLLGESIAKVDSKYIIRDITAPGAPASWSFAAYEEDKVKHKADVVILGIMTENVQYLSATAGTTSYFDMSHPYTFPRYFVEDGQLKEIYPPFFTSEGYREYFFNLKKWGEYCDWLAKNDKFYDPILFKRSLTDMSAMLRVLRRAYSERIKEKRVSQVYTREGFNLNSEEVVVLHGIVKAFAQSARKQKSLPIVYIVNNEGRGNHLYRALKPVLEANNIPFLSTHIICPPDDPRIFTGVNSHFIPSKDMELAREVIKIIETEQKKKGQHL